MPRSPTGSCLVGPAWFLLLPRETFLLYFYILYCYIQVISGKPLVTEGWRLAARGTNIVTLVVVESLSNIQLLETPWTAARQASLSFTISQNLFKLMSIESVMPPNHLILCCPLLLLTSIFPSIRVFPMSQLITSRGQSIGASASVLTMNIQGWFPFRLTDLISLLS